jgi:hypothetical protein
MSMKATCRALALALLLAPAASFATKVPIPIEGATLNVSFQVQPEFLVNEAGTPAGDGPSYDIWVRRTRLLVNGDLGPNFTYLVQIDNPNFGKFGNFSGRAIVQDAWVGWAPTGITGGTVIYIDAGILLIPISHHLLESTTNFVTADVQTDAFRLPSNGFQGLRDTGVQIRGWALDKKIGFRGGVYEGYAPFNTPGTGTTAVVGGAVVPVVPAGACTQLGAPAVPTAPVGGVQAVAAPACITPKRNPMLGGFINFDIIGSEEGGWLYGAYKWGKDPILSVGLAGNYQSQALKNAFGNLTDVKLFAADVYLNFPMTEAAELVAEGTAYINGNGSGSSNTGLGLSGNLAYRFGFIAPYVAYDYFKASDCDASSLSAAQFSICVGSPGKIGTVGAADSRNLKAGLNFFFNKNLNHLNIEFQVNHGQSAFGPQSINAANAGYVPLSLDPLVANGPRRAINTLLTSPAYKSLFVHWNFLF